MWICICHSENILKISSCFVNNKFVSAGNYQWLPFVTNKDKEKDYKLKSVRVFLLFIWNLSRWCCSCRFFKEEFQQTDDQDFRDIDLLQCHELNNGLGDPSSPFCRQVSESGHAYYILPSPCTASSHAFAVNAFRLRIRVDQPGDALKTQLGPRDPKRIGRAEYWGLETRQDYI